MAQAMAGQAMPPPIDESAKEPIRYVGERVPDPYYYDGKLPHAAGVHHYQVYRANRSEPIEGGDALLSPLSQRPRRCKDPTMRMC